MEKEKINQIKKWLGSGSINIFGKPLSGKDTQAKILSELIEAPIIGGGDIIRSNEDAEIKKIIDEGHLIPQDKYLSLVLPFLSKSSYRKKPLILNSLGRWYGEEAPIIEAANTSNHKIMVVIYLDVSDQDVKNRLMSSKELKDRGSRNDDHLDVIDNRLIEFSQKTIPVINHYKALGLLLDIDGNQNPKEVTATIIDALYEKSNQTLINAPDFKLHDQDNNLRSLSDYAGKWLVLYFYPKDDTPGCTKEACSFRDGREIIAKLGNAEVIGISKDSVKSHAKFASKYKLNFTLLSDEDHKVIEAYNSWGVKKFMGREYMGTSRNTFIINPTGKIVKFYENVSPNDHANEIINDLKKLQADIK